MAAVNNGADAVYLGLGDLNARRGAENFDLESLAGATRFAHLRGARVYLTANIVVLDDEVGPALAMIDGAWAAGIDAVIVQDLGLLRIVRTALPQVRVHASTQIDAMNPEAVRALADMGVHRVTLARELSPDAIRACAAAGVEVEAFVHGALCYCYSGQCLMSSMIGRRSANRGLCAQPCRLSYQLLDATGSAVQVPGRYLLSTRDLAGIAHLPELVAAGVSALKIEGRMKSPEYVAVVVGVYRRALDRALADLDGFRVTPSEWEMLEESFNRGFTDGYLTDQRGAELMSYTRPNNRGVFVGRVSGVEGRRALVAVERALEAEDTIEIWTRDGRFAQTVGSLTVDGHPVTRTPAGGVVGVTTQRAVAVGDRVFRVANAALLEAARRTFEGPAAMEHHAVSVEFAVEVRMGRPLRLTAAAGDARATAEGPVVEAARTKALTADEIVAHIGRLGGSGYHAAGWSIDMDAGIGMGFSALHAIRREVLAALDEVRLEPWSGRTRTRPRGPALSARSAPRAALPRIVVTAWSEDLVRAALEAGADDALVRVFGPPEEPPSPAAPGALLPRIAWPDEVGPLSRWLDGGLAVVGNLGMLPLAAARGPVEADWPLNTLNAHAAAALDDMGARLVWASPELSGRQLARLVERSPVPIGCVIWGRTELMVAEQCVLQASGPCNRRCGACARRRGWWRLRDQKGYEFPVTTDASGRSHIMNAVTLDLTRALEEVLASGVAAVRLDFSDETPQRAAEVTRSVRSAVEMVAAGAPPPAVTLVEPATSGHFFRGVR